ncbi:MAG TPA: hypothetical protein VNH20_06175 [Candidatus Dormibacteraeota bacterium]|nr:hypothetical protein [Candidatus Dormibacteraeota bacterium]
MAVKGRQQRRGGGVPFRVAGSAWPVAVSAVGSWLRQQARREGPVGGAAELTVVVVNRSATLLCELSAEVARATARPDHEADHQGPAKRRSSGSKDRPKSAAPRRSKPAS